MNVELVGPAGSGKSFLLKKMICRVGYKNLVHQKKIAGLLAGLKIYNFLSSLDDSPYRFVSKKAFKFYDYLYALRISKPDYDDCREVVHAFQRALLIDDHYEKRKSIFQRALNQYLFSIDPSIVSNYIFCFDEGLAQRGCSLVYSGCEMRDLKAFYNIAPVPSKLVFLDVSKERVEMNLLKRDGVNSRFIEMIEKGFEACEICCDIYSRRGVDIIVCDDSSQSDFVLNRIGVPL